LKASESLAKQWGFNNWKGFASSSSTATTQQPAAFPLDPGKELTALQSQSSTDHEAAFAEASPQSRAAAAATAAAAALAAKTKAACSGTSLGNPSVTVDKKSAASEALHRGPVVISAAAAAAAAAAKASQGHKMHKKSVDFDVLMNVLETNGFSYADRGIFSYFWCKVRGY
jgi:hypothetical protein